MALGVERVTLDAAYRLGWDVGVAGEARLAIALTHAGVSRDGWELQFKLGPYRLDFAHPLYRIDLEADGWVHTAKRMRDRDHARDRRLHAWGWDVLRVDTDCDASILKAATYLRHAMGDLPRYEGVLWREGRTTYFRGE